MTDFLSQFDFSLNILREKIPGSGEDCSYFCFAPAGGMAVVADGCGGSGARKYPGYRGNTGAYMASRVVCGAVKDWFAELRLGLHSPSDTESLTEKISSYMTLCRNVAGDSGGRAIKGSLSQEFPTTLAMVYILSENGRSVAHCCWAGDSRCYMLNTAGLHQLSRDDLDVQDAMENLSEDGVMNNVITATKKYTLHHTAFSFSGPALFFSATDGCFGYFSTPMEFEYLLLSSLEEAQSPAQWENGITAVLDKVAGDDFTLNAMALGRGSFPAWKQAFRERTELLRERYMQGLAKSSKEEKLKLWNTYKDEYAKFIKEEKRP